MESEAPGDSRVRERFQGLRGTPLTKPEVTVGGDGFVEGEVSGLKAIGTVTNVADGEVDNEIVWDWAEGFGEGNYDITKTEGKLSIEPQSVDPDNPESYTGIKVGELSDLLYKGKDQFQEPMVTDAKGNLLVKDRDYTLAFDGDARNCDRCWCFRDGFGYWQLQG